MGLGQAAANQVPSISAGGFQLPGETRSNIGNQALIALGAQLMSPQLATSASGNQHMDIGGTLGSALTGALGLINERSNTAATQGAVLEEARRRRLSDANSLPLRDAQIENLLASARSHDRPRPTSMSAGEQRRRQDLITMQAIENMSDEEFAARTGARNPAQLKERLKLNIGSSEFRSILENETTPISKDYTALIDAEGNYVNYDSSTGSFSPTGQSASVAFETGDRNVNEDDRLINERMESIRPFFMIQHMDMLMGEQSQAERLFGIVPAKEGREPDIAGFNRLLFDEATRQLQSEGRLTGVSNSSQQSTPSAPAPTPAAPGSVDSPQPTSSAPALTHRDLTPEQEQFVASARKSPKLKQDPAGARAYLEGQGVPAHIINLIMEGF